MSRSGPLHHNRVAKNVAPSCVYSWGYMYGRRRIVTCPTPVRSVFRRGHGVASRSGITQRARPLQPCGEADRSTETVQIADEDEIDFGVSRTGTTPTVSPVEFAARATRSSPHERDRRRNREPVRHVVTRCRANGGSSHKRPRFILHRACRISTHVSHMATCSILLVARCGRRRLRVETTSAAQGEPFGRHSFTIARGIT